MSPDPSSFASVESREASKVAALDIGSNSFHLVVARIVAGSVQILHRVKQKVRLAEGLNEDNVLQGEAKQRGLDTLKIIADSLKGFEPDSVRIVATHTLRRAVNAKEFIEEAKKHIPEVQASIVTHQKDVDEIQCETMVNENFGVKYRARRYNIVG